MIAELIGSLIAVIYGACSCYRKKTPLFYKIVFYSALTCLIGNIYTLLYGILWWPVGSEFHIGYLGYVGMFFFLYSSYYGAIDSLADGKQPELRRFRAVAVIIAAAFFVASALLIFFGGKAFWKGIIVIPVSLTLYFAMKHLIIPDVDMGIIKVMRPYNALVICLCICMMLRLVSMPYSMLGTVSSICTGVLLAVYLPVARNGVRKWFI